MAGCHVAVLLKLADGPRHAAGSLTKQRFVQVGVGCRAHGVARRGGHCHQAGPAQVGGPRSRDVGPIHDRLVDSHAKRFDEGRANLCPDVERAVIQHGFGNGDDDGQFLGFDVLVGPTDLGRLLEAGVAADKVRRRQRIHDRQAALLRAHVGETASQAHDRARFGNGLENFRGCILWNEGGRVRTGDIAVEWHFATSTW